MTRWTKASEREVGWLGPLLVPYSEAWVVEGFGCTLLLLSPFEVLENDRLPREVTWQAVAEHVGVTFQGTTTLLERLTRLQRTTAGLLDGHTLYGPGEGSLHVPAREALRHALLAGDGPASDELTVGFYPRWAVPAGMPESQVITRMVGVLEMGFASTSREEFLTDWAGDLQPWSESVAFVWPRSREWMLQVDPDSEALPGDPSGPYGSTG